MAAAGTEINGPAMHRGADRARCRGRRGPV